MVVVLAARRYRYTLRTVKTSVEVLEDNKVKVNVEVDETEFEREVDLAFKRIAKEVRLPGFRPGKAPRRLLEARIGVAAGREEALRESVPAYYTRAVIEHDVDVIAPPEIDITAGRDSGAVVFDAIVAVRPRVSIGGYRGLRVEIPSPMATDEDVQRYLDRLRNQFAEIVPVDRPAADGDHVTIDISGTLDDEVVPGLTAEDYLYEVGSGTVLPEIDENLRGSSAGEVLDFTAAHPDPDEDRELELTITVKEVKEKILPEVDDEFATQASEFATAAELRDDITNRLSGVKRSQAKMSLRAKAQEELAKLVDDDVPPSMVSNEMQARLEDLSNRLRAQGIGLEQYIQMMGRTPEQVSEELRVGATESVKLDLALRALAEAESIEITDDEVMAEIATFASEVKQDPATVYTRFRENGQLSGLRSTLAKNRALDWLLEQVEVVDENGTPVDRVALLADDPEPEAIDSTDAGDPDEES
jgi:trigger factor